MSVCTELTITIIVYGGGQSEAEPILRPIQEFCKDSMPDHPLRLQVMKLSAEVVFKMGYMDKVYSKTCILYGLSSIYGPQTDMGI